MNENCLESPFAAQTILPQLQTKRLLTATELANKFSFSIRTIYRDVRTLEQSGVPILTEEGKGYALMEGDYFEAIKQATLCLKLKDFLLH